MMPWLNRHRRFRDQLSAYIDSALSPDESNALETHLHSCVACRVELDDLRAAVIAVRGLPLLDAPRSFVLTPDQAARPSRSPLPPTPPLAVGMRLAGAALACALAVVLVVDFGDIGQSGGGGESSSGAVQKSASLDEGAPKAASNVGETPGAEATTAAPGLYGTYDTTRASSPAADSACSTVGATLATQSPTPPALDELTPAPAYTQVPQGANAGSVAGGAPSTAPGCLEGGAANPSANTDAIPCPSAVTTVEQLERCGAPQLAARDLAEAQEEGLSTLRGVEIGLAAALAVVVAGLGATFIAGRRWPA